MDVDLAMPTRFPEISMPDIDLKKYAVVMMEWLSALSRTMSQDRYTIMDLIYSYKPTGDLFNLVPPFKSKSSSQGY